MGRGLGKLAHAHGAERRLYPADHLILRHAQVFQPEGHVLPHHVGHDLVIRVLEHHARMAADIPDPFLRQGVHAAHQHPALRGQEQGVHQLGQRAFARAVMPQHRHKAAPFHLQRYVADGGPCVGFVLIAHVLHPKGKDVRFLLHRAFLLQENHRARKKRVSL